VCRWGNQTLSTQLIRFLYDSGARILSYCRTGHGLDVDELTLDTHTVLIHRLDRRSFLTDSFEFLQLLFELLDINVVSRELDFFLNEAIQELLVDRSNEISLLLDLLTRLLGDLHRT